MNKIKKQAEKFAGAFYTAQRDRSVAFDAFRRGAEWVLRWHDVCEAELPESGVCLLLKIKGVRFEGLALGHYETRSDGSSYWHKHDNHIWAEVIAWRYLFLND